VPGQPDVVRQLRGHLGDAGRASLLAADGAVTTGVFSQLGRLPADATHLVLSVGGNDALGHLDFLGRSARSVAGVLMELAAMAEDFEGRYRATLARVLEHGLPTALCTIYYPRFPDAEAQRLAVTALSAFNDAILRAAFEARLPVIDLRLVCSDEADYANPIEPSARGGGKIAAAIARLLGHAPFRTDHSLVIA
jgi:hypothetical protein